jgi:hypothetical protein
MARSQEEAMQTRVSPKLVALVGLFGVALAQAACNAEAPADEELEADSTEQPIIGNPDQASTYPEAALVDMSRGGRTVSICSGSIIAPRVVLTAGHCVDGFDGFSVKLPYAGGQTATAEGAAVFDYSQRLGIREPEPTRRGPRVPLARSRSPRSPTLAKHRDGALDGSRSVEA